MVIDMKAHGVAFALPLVAAPELEELDGPLFELLLSVIGVDARDNFQDCFGALLIADGSPFHGVENGVRHEVGFVGLFVVLGLINIGAWDFAVSGRKPFDRFGCSGED